MERVHGSTSSNELHALLERDGAVIVEEMIPSSQLSALNRELDDIVANTVPGMRNPKEGGGGDFFGRSTIRVDGLPAESPTFVDIM